MPLNESDKTPSKSFWFIAYGALIWNIIGIITFMMTVTISPEALELMPIEERNLYTEIPLAITVAYAIAVFGGTLACALLLLRKSIGVSAFVLSFVAIIVQMGYTLLFSSVIEVQGLPALALPFSIIIVAACLVWYSMAVGKRGWYI